MKAPAFLFLLASGAAQACGFHGVVGDGFSVMHPRSMTVAFAVRDAVDQKILTATPVEGAAGYARAVLRVNALHRRLGSEVSVSLLLVDSGLWTQFHPLAAHAAGPRPGDVVVLTSEEVLAAVLDGRVAVETALNRGLIVVDGEADSAESVRTTLRKKLTP